MGRRCVKWLFLTAANAKILLAVATCRSHAPVLSIFFRQGVQFWAAVDAEESISEFILEAAPVPSPSSIEGIS